MHRLAAPWPLAALCLLAAACSSPSGSEPQPPPAAQRAPDPSAAPAAPTAPAPPAAPLDLPVTAATATAAGREQPLVRDAPTVVEAGAQFKVELGVPLQDGRLSLLDGDGAMVAATGTTEIGASWMRLTLAPEAPLVAGSAYALKLDGALERAAHDPDGRAYAPASWPLRTSGERPRPEPKKKAEKPRR